MSEHDYTCDKFKVGDKGQRYEVTYFDPRSNTRKVFGWSETTKGAQAMANSIDAHPVWEFPQVRDRRASPEKDPER
jgi:hypothetical protein